MKKNILLRTNLIICTIITIGFFITSYISYQFNFGIFEKDIEHVSTLALDGIYRQIDSIFSQPINVSLTMANDSLLIKLLSKEIQFIENEAYIKELQNYLNAYRIKYNYDSVFLVSAATNRYYHFNGLDRVLTQDNPENNWYYDFLGSSEEYSLNLDNDEADDDTITSFINCKIKDESGSIIGVVGVGMKTQNIKKLLNEYDDIYSTTAYLTDDKGTIQIASLEEHEGMNLFAEPEYSEYQNIILNNQTESQAFWYHSDLVDGHINAQYLPALKWHLIITNDTTEINKKFHYELAGGILIIILIIISVQFIITRVINKYNEQIIALTVAPELEYQHLLHKATEELYENIYEFDITHDCAGGEGTRNFFESLGISRDASYGSALKAICSKQIKDEYTKGYLDTFSAEKVLKTFSNGINNLTYDFLKKDTNEGYSWVRITAQIFFWSSDQSVRMITYRKNIDTEKKRELTLLEMSQRDSLTDLFNKRTSEDLIADTLAKSLPSSRHVLLILDIDNFKTVNDNMGHAFGDTVIAEFASELKNQFLDTDIVGRIGGDEFMVLIKNYKNLDVLENKLKRFCSRLDHKKFGNTDNFNVSTSIGGALFPDHGCTYSELYEKADQALYFAKGHGKGTFNLFGKEFADSNVYHVSTRDLDLLINLAADGISKIALMNERLKILYCNEKRLTLTGIAEAELNNGYDLVHHIHPEDLLRVLDIFKNSDVSKVPFSVYFRLRHRLGHYIPVRLKGVFINELYENKYPIFYAVYTNMSSAAEG